MEETSVEQQQPLKKGGRRSRRVNMWAKAAGEYYHSHKNDPKIKEFSDVLKSPDFKAYYQSKYGHGKKYVQKPEYTKKQYKKFTPLKNSTRTRIDSLTKLPVTDLNRAPQRGADSNLHRYKKSRDYYQEERVPRNKYEEEREEQEYKPKMKKTRKSQPKEESGWKWGGVKGPE